LAKVDIHVRPGDCDALGHVNNAAYINYLEQAFAEAVAALGYDTDWRREGEFTWQLRSLSIEYRAPAVFGDRLSAEIWLQEADLKAPAFGFEIQRTAGVGSAESSGAICAARSVWRRVSRQIGEPVSCPEAVLDGFSKSGGSLPRPFDLPEASPEIRAYDWNHDVAVYEPGVSGWVRAEAIYHWLQVSVDAACTQAGWPLERRLAEGFVVFQTRHDSQFFAFPKYGDRVRVTSRAIEVRRLRGTWLQELRRMPQGELLGRDYSTGVFLSPDGRPATPPQEMMRDIQYGE
jgi:YbgC/YbaW family acyl-CoA thioester hydrolase